MASALMCSCTKPTQNKPMPDPEPDPKPVEVAFAKGADISWVTEMEDKGYKFYDASGKEKDCTVLMKELGFNSIRLRVWVDPKDGYCNQSDVLLKAKRASALGLKVMIDFHYSDSWADPSKQNIPAAWKGHDASQLATDVAEHTKEVLTSLKLLGVDVGWVQIGNEVTGGFLWDLCKVSGKEAANFIKCFNAGSDEVKKLYPDAKVVLHVDNGWKMDTLNWFYGLMGSAKYDIIGLSLYPSYWENGAYGDWNAKTKQCMNNITSLNATYHKEVMIVEFGMPASQPEKAKDALQFILDNASDKPYFKGIFLWEPEAEHSRNNYDYGAFADGKPTIALDPIK